MPTVNRLTLIVSLWLNGDDVAAYESFERLAAGLLRRHDGKIERAIRITPSDGDPSAPFEVHIVTFPHRRNLDAYRADPDVKRLAAVREKVIAKTVMLEGFDLNGY